MLFLVYPILGETDQEVRARHQRMIASPGFVEATLAAVGTVTDIDFSGLDLDQPLPPPITNGEQGSLDKFAQWRSAKTLRQLAQERFDAAIPLIGSPDIVADRMGDAMEAIGGDGLLISTPFQPISRRVATEVYEGLIPAL